MNKPSLPHYLYLIILTISLSLINLSTQGITIAIGCATDAEWTALYSKIQTVATQAPTILKIQADDLFETAGGDIYHFQISGDLSIILFKTQKAVKAISEFSIILATFSYLESYPHILFFIGTAGGLNEQATIGSFVIAQEIGILENLRVTNTPQEATHSAPPKKLHSVGSFSFSLEKSILADEKLIPMLSIENAQIGTFITSPLLIDKKETAQAISIVYAEKRNQSHPVVPLVCDQEAYHVLKACNSKKIPCVVIKVITDMAGRTGGESPITENTLELMPLLAEEALKFALEIPGNVEITSHLMHNRIHYHKLQKTRPLSWDGDIEARTNLQRATSAPPSFSIKRRANSYSFSKK